MTQQLELPCPLCGTTPMRLTGSKHNEQFYRCLGNHCYGSRDVEGATFREESDDHNRSFIRIDRFGNRSRIRRTETAPQGMLEPIPGQPGLFRNPQDPNRVINTRDFFASADRKFCRGEWYSDLGSMGRADPMDITSMASKLEQLYVGPLAAEPQRTIARMFAVIDHRPLPRIEISTANFRGDMKDVNIPARPMNTPASVTSERIRDLTKPYGTPATPSTQETPMTDDKTPAPKKTTRARLADQGKDIGSAILDGLAEATVEEAGDVLLDMAKELFEGEAMLQIFLATPDGRELVKGLMALVIDSAAVHTNIPKAAAIRKLARYQFRSTSRRVGGPRIKKIMMRFGRLIDLAERLPELPEGETKVVDFAESTEAVNSR